MAEIRVWQATKVARGSAQQVPRLRLLRASLGRGWWRTGRRMKSGRNVGCHKNSWDRGKVFQRGCSNHVCFCRSRIVVGATGLAVQPWNAAGWPWVALRSWSPGRYALCALCVPCRLSRRLVGPGAGQPGVRPQKMTRYSIVCQMRRSKSPGTLGYLGNYPSTYTRCSEG